MSANIVDLTSRNFTNEVRNTDQVVMIDFWATWCMPCRMVSPTIDQLAEQYKGSIKVCKVNIDKEPELANQFGIMSIPTVIAVKNGVVCDKLVGAMPKQYYAKMLDNCLTKAV